MPCLKPKDSDLIGIGCSLGPKTFNTSQGDTDGQGSLTRLF